LEIIFNISLGIALVFYIVFSLLIDFSGKDLPFIYLGIVLLFASELLNKGI
jgi:diacylglycerol kinase